MAKCDLTIHLDEERATYRGGDVVRGEIEVRTDEDVRCDALTAELRWKTHGKGNTARGEPIEIELFQGEWRAGTIQRHPFALQLPHGPFTYHGHYLNVVWEVRARADVPWAIDPKAEREIAVAPDPEAEPDWQALLGDPEQSHRIPEELRERAGVPEQQKVRIGGPAGAVLGYGCLGLLLLPILAMLAVSVWQGIQLARGEAEEPLEAVLWIVFSVVFVVLFGGGGWRLLRNKIARRRLGEVTFHAEPRLVRPGDAVRLELLCRPGKQTELDRAVARLEAEEVVVRGSGTDRRTYRHTVHTEEIELAAGRSLPGGLPFQIEREIRIPADAPPSFVARSNTLRWSVTAELDVARWPDWGEDRELLVHP